MDINKDRFAIESELLERLHAAQEKYKQKAAEHDKIVNEIQSGIGVSYPPDALETATGARKAAFAEYEKAVREFNDFILRGKRPGEKRTE
jgi:hypothetical protein